MQSSLLANMTLNQCVFASISPRAGISDMHQARPQKKYPVCVCDVKGGSHPHSLVKSP